MDIPAWVLARGLGRATMGRRDRHRLDRLHGGHHAIQRTAGVRSATVIVAWSPRYSVDWFSHTTRYRGRAADGSQHTRMNTYGGSSGLHVRTLRGPRTHWDGIYRGSRRTGTVGLLGLFRTSVFQGFRKLTVIAALLGFCERHQPSRREPSPCPQTEQDRIHQLHLERLGDCLRRFML